jgi:DNA-directed RNA polymerase specialized sigma24 family protein
MTESPPTEDLQTLSDEDLWTRFVGGDDEAIGVLAGRHRDQVFWYLLLSTGKQDDAARNSRAVWALLAAWRAPYEGFGSFRSWLYAVATQNAVPATHPEMFGLGDLIDDLKRGEPESHRARVFYAIVDMTRAVRQPLLLTAVAGLTLEDAAKACNFTVERTRRCLARAYSQLAGQTAFVERVEDGDEVQ